MYSSKIVFLIADLGSGGAQRVIATLSNYWVTVGMQVEILTLENTDCFYQLDNSVNVTGLKYKRFSTFFHPLNSFLNNLSKLYFLRKKFLHEPTSAYISFIDTTNILALIASRFLNIRLTISDRNNLSDVKLTSSWLFLRRKYYKRASCLVLQTKGVIKEYNKFNIKLPDIKIIPNPVLQQNRTLAVFKKENILISVGRLHKDKGFDLMIAAYAQSKVEWPLYILGEGPERHSLELQIAEAGLQSSIFLLGNIEDVQTYYSKAAIFLFTSKTEGMPNALLEAMSFGCACISMDCPYGPSEIIDHYKDGILIPHGNIAFFAESLASLVKNKELLSALSKESIQKSSNYSIDKISNMWLKTMFSN